MKLSWRTLGMVGALALIWIGFSLSTHGTFLSPRNLSLLARQMSVTSILATGMVLVIVSGQIDLSVGALAGLCGAFAAQLCAAGWPLGAAFAGALGMGTLLGLGQGSMVAYLGIPPFIVTLGGMLLFQGSLLGITGGISVVPPPDFLFIGQYYLSPQAGWILGGLWALASAWRAHRSSKRMKWALLGAAGLGAVGLANAYQGLPLPVILMLGLAAAFWVLASQTAFGRHLYAIGGNREAAFYSGISIERHLIGAFGLMGMVAGVAGIVLTARVGAASSDAGRMMELDAIAAAVIGGTSLLGGRGTVWGAILGATVMASLDNGMSLMNTEAFWQPIIKGAILIAAVGADMAGRAKD